MLLELLGFTAFGILAVLILFHPEAGCQTTAWLFFQFFEFRTKWSLLGSICCLLLVHTGWALHCRFVHVVGAARLLVNTVPICLLTNCQLGCVMVCGLSHVSAWLSTRWRFPNEEKRFLHHEVLDGAVLGHGGAVSYAEGYNGYLVCGYRFSRRLSSRYFEGYRLPVQSLDLAIGGYGSALYSSRLRLHVLLEDILFILL